MTKLTDRDRRVTETALRLIDGDTTPTGEREAAFYRLRHLADKHRLGLADLLAAVRPGTGEAASLRGQLEAALREADRLREQLKRAFDKLQRRGDQRLAAANAARTDNAAHHAETVVWPAIAAIRRDLGRDLSYQAIAEELTRRRVPTPSGKTSWARQQVRRVFLHLGRQRRRAA